MQTLRALGVKAARKRGADAPGRAGDSTARPARAAIGSSHAAYMFAELPRVANPCGASPRGRSPHERRHAIAAADRRRSRAQRAAGRAHPRRDRRDRRGWISFERFMEMALYEPGLGYYSAGATKLGAPAISSPRRRSRRCSVAASRTNARRFCEQLPDAQILELGAGSGVMAADDPRRARSAGRLPERYLILEVSADLRERQTTTCCNERAPQHVAARANGSIAWPKIFAASCSRTKCSMRCRCSASASAASRSMRSA